MKKKNWYALGLLLCLATAGVIGCIGEENGMTEKKSREIAREFVETSPTYAYDGMDLQHKETLYPDIAECEHCYTFVFTFTSRHGGYGDRSGKMVTQVLTPHEAHITIENGEITSAILDEKWDMLKQKMIE